MKPESFTVTLNVTKRQNKALEWRLGREVTPDVIKEMVNDAFNRNIVEIERDYSFRNAGGVS